MPKHLAVILSVLSLLSVMNATWLHSEEERHGDEEAKAVKEMEKKVIQATEALHTLNTTLKSNNFFLANKSLKNAPSENAVIAPGGNAWSFIAGTVFSRATSQLAYAGFLELQRRADVPLQEAFLPTSLSTMNTADSAGSLFASTLAKSFESDAKDFPQNLARYLESNPPKTTYGKVLAKICRAVVVNGDDIVFDLALLIPQRISQPNEEFKVQTGVVIGNIDDELLTVDKAFFVIGTVAVAYRLLHSQWTNNPKERDAVLLVLEGALQSHFPDIAFDKVKPIASQLLDDIRQMHLFVDNINNRMVNPSGKFDGSAAEKLADHIENIFTSFDKLTNLFTPVETNGATAKMIAAVRAKTALIRRIITHAIRGYASFAKNEYVAGVTHITAIINSYYSITNSGDEGKPGKSVTALLNWAGVIASMAEAKDQESFTAMVDSISDPIGAYRTLRIHEGWYFSVKSYLGGTVGAEWVRRSGDTTDEVGGYSAIFAPVGLEFGKTTGSDYISTVGIFLSPIDVGSITATRFDSETESEDPDFNDIFAPGAYLTLGLSKNWPISIGAGYQYSPNQRHDASTGDSLRAHRALVFIGVDIPFLSRKW